MTSVPPPRCAEHDLALGPGGQCILCRRAQSSVVVPVPAEATSSAPVWLIGGVAAVALAGAAAWTTLGPGLRNPPPSAAPAVVTSRTEAPKLNPVAATKPPEDDLTRSLRMLEEAERKRLALEQDLQQREQEQRTAAALQREREAKVRDAQRHEEVKRELDALGLAAARRNVSITMYSTSWCGVCNRARAYMREQQIPFTELDVDHDAAASARQRTLNPRGSVPTIAIDDEVLIGFSAESLEKRIDRAARHRAGS
jgi:glutaredoxin